jgi:hypothetical protein
MGQERDRGKPANPVVTEGSELPLEMASMVDQLSAEE